MREHSRIPICVKHNKPIIGMVPYSSENSFNRKSGESCQGAYAVCVDCKLPPVHYTRREESALREHT